MGTYNYDRIANAIEYFSKHHTDQPNLEEVAKKINMSPFHFQRMFTDWAGVSPKKILQFVTVEYAKDILQDKNATLSDATFETGLSGTSRLHRISKSVRYRQPRINISFRTIQPCKP